MIRSIATEIEKIQPAPLYYTKLHNQHLNKGIKTAFLKQRIPIIVADVATERLRIRQEIMFAKHILHRANCGFARSILISLLAFDLEDLFRKVI